MENKSKETYKRVSKLGEGAFGKVYLVQCSSDNSYAAVKQLDLRNMPDDEIEDLKKETSMLEIMHHPNIIYMKEFYITKNKKLCIVMEYADGGDLKKSID